MLVPAVNSLELMPSGEPGVTVGLAHTERHFLGSEIGLKGRFVGVGELLGIFREP